MKLTGITIDGYRNPHAIRLTQISPTMNLIYGEKDTGKTRIANFISDILFGESSDASVANASAIKGAKPFQRAAGSLDIDHATGQFSLSRDFHHRNDLTVTPALGSVAGQGLNQIAGPLDVELFDTFYNTSFDTRQSSIANLSLHPHQLNPTLADVLHRRLGVPVGPDAAGHSSPSEQQIQTLASLRSEIQTVSARISALQNQSQQFTSQINAVAANASTINVRSREIGQQIAALEIRIRNLTVNPHAEELAQIAAEIQQLQTAIDTAKPTYVTAASLPDHTALLYEQIDEIDTQIQRWRSLQNEVQQQRVVLKDEMLSWNQLTLESPQHPYHTARKLLLNLETRVDTAESQTLQWLDSHGPIDSHQAAGFVNDVSKGMRGDLYDLCDELGKQYKQIRHRSAAAELKRLRRCYEEISENVTRLIQRRHATIDQIRLVDVAGANAIAGSDEAFIQHAARQGHLKARQHFVGPLPAAPSTTQMVPPDLTALRSQLQQLENRRAGLQHHGVNNTLEMTQLQSQLSNLRSEQATLNPPDDSQLRRDLATTERELQTAIALSQSLNDQLKRTSHIVPTAPHPLLTQAGKTLTRLSHGELNQIWLSNDGNAMELQVQDRHQRVLRLSALTATMRTQVELSLVLASVKSLAATGIEAPLIIDELFERFESDRIDTALQVLNEFAQQGHQTIMLTQHRFLIDRANNYGTVRFFDLQSLAASQPATPTSAVVPQTPTAYVPPANVPSSVPDSKVVSKTHSVIPPTPTIVSTPEPATIAFPTAHTFSANGSRHASFASPSFQSRTASVASIKADQIGDRLEYATTFESHSLLSDVPIFDSIQLRTFNEDGIETIDDLLAVDLDALPAHWNDAGLTATIVDNMQSEVWLLTCVPALRPYDAHVLVACGIYEPDQLETSAAQNLLERVQRYLNANAAEHEFDRDYSITIERISDWHKGLVKTKKRWRNRRPRRNRRSEHRDGRSNFESTSTTRPSRSTTQHARSVGPQIRRHDADYDRTGNGRTDRDFNNRDYDDRGYQRTPRRDHNDRQHSDRQHDDRNRKDRAYSDRGYRDPNANQRLSEQQRSQRSDNIIRVDRSDSSLNSHSRSTADRDDRLARTPRMVTPTPETYRRSVPAIEPDSPRSKDSKPAAKRTSPQSTKSTHKFYLDLEDHIEAAPSIGPKTAERFEKIGVFTIAEFLKQTADSMAAKLNYKRMSAEVVRSWQQQARLVCRIPNLRGHDAQLLVACEIFEPEEIASMQPQALFRIIQPFSDTKEGLKIIRSGKKPDLAEITDWIAWAQHTRSLQAA